MATIRHKLMAMIATVIAASACTENKIQTPAESLLERLENQREQGKIMFGHQDSYLYGHSWKVEADATEFDRSDLHDVTGKYPALYGMDLGGIELAERIQAHPQGCQLQLLWR